MFSDYAYLVNIGNSDEITISDLQNRALNLLIQSKSSLQRVACRRSVTEKTRYNINKKEVGNL